MGGRAVPSLPEMVFNRDEGRPESRSEGVVLSDGLNEGGGLQRCFRSRSPWSGR